MSFRPSKAQPAGQMLSPPLSAPRGPLQSGAKIARRNTDARSPRSSHPPLSHPRNRKRQLPLQEQLGESSQTRKGETSELDERLTPNPSSSRVSSQWKSQAKSQRKSTV